MAQSMIPTDDHELIRKLDMQVEKIASSLTDFSAHVHSSSQTIVEIAAETHKQIDFMNNWHTFLSESKKIAEAAAAANK
jgi:hypothetical protein